MVARGTIMVARGNIMVRLARAPTLPLMSAAKLCLMVHCLCMSAVALDLKYNILKILQKN